MWSDTSFDVLAILSVLVTSATLAAITFMTYSAYQHKQIDSKNKAAAETSVSMLAWAGAFNLKKSGADVCMQVGDATMLNKAAVANEPIKAVPCVYNSVNQKFLFDIPTKTLRWKDATDHITCVSSDTSNNLVINVCKDKDATQQWAYDTLLGRITQNGTNNCMTISGDQMTLQPCVSGNSNQGFITT